MKALCSVYPEGIPNNIWADENADCSDFEKK